MVGNGMHGVFTTETAILPLLPKRFLRNKVMNSFFLNGAVFLTKMAICNCAPESNIIGPLYFGVIYNMVLLF